MISRLPPTPAGVLAFTVDAPVFVALLLPVDGGGGATACVSGVGTALEIAEIDIQFLHSPVLGFRSGKQQGLPIPERCGRGSERRFWRSDRSQTLRPTAAHRSLASASRNATQE